jgi:hypothetical protein
MADQTVHIDNLDRSNERVAFNLMEKIAYADKNESPKTKQEFIDLYVDCLWATRGNRAGGK